MSSPFTVLISETLTFSLIGGQMSSSAISTGFSLLHLNNEEKNASFKTESMDLDTS